MTDFIKIRPVGAEFIK